MVPFRRGCEAVIRLLFVDAAAVNRGRIYEKQRNSCLKPSARGDPREFLIRKNNYSVAAVQTLW